MINRNEIQRSIDLLQPSFMKEVLSRSFNESLTPSFQPSEIISFSGWSVITPKAALRLSVFSKALTRGYYSEAANALLDIQDMIENGDVK